MQDLYRPARDRMVSSQIEARGVQDKRVLEVMRRIPRHFFVDEAMEGKAYHDCPLPIGYGQTISQPYIVAFMTETLELTGTEKVLEIGTGSGYQTAILAELANSVFSVERIQPLYVRARRLLDKLGYKKVLVKLDDGTCGWKDEAPFDTIIVTAGAPFIPQPLLLQLNDPGIMVIPIGDSFSQTLIKIRKAGGEIFMQELLDVRFVKLTGEYGWKVA